MDLGIIAATKKRYRFLLLRRVLAYTDLTPVAQDALAAEAASMHAGAAGIAHGRPAHVLDAAGLIKEAWDAISATTIENAFAKANLRSTYRCSKEVDVNEDIDFLPLVDSIDGLTMDGLEEYLECDNRRSVSYLSSIFEELEL
jgi:hypothetical protein